MMSKILNKKKRAAQGIHHASLTFCLFFVALSLICGIAPAYGQSAPYAEYVILMIADGWGQTKIDAANMYTGSVPLYQTDPLLKKHWMTTYPYGCGYNTEQAWGNFSYVFNCVTDSAAAATALYSGIKTQNGRISVSFNAIDRLFTVGEIAKTYGAGVGAITTVPVSDATLGAMVAHNDSRANYYAIADEGFFGDPNTTGAPSELSYGGGHGPTFPVADVLIGDGREGYVSTAAKVKLRAEKGSLGDPGRNTAKHYIVERQTGLDAGLSLMQAAVDPYVTKLAGLFDHVFRKADGSGYNPENPTLSESTEAALTVLSKNPDGFVLMIESGAVDWAGHANNMDYTVGEMIDFNEAVQTVIDWVDDPSNDSNWDNTLLIITGDHETGYLTAGPGRFPDQPIGPVNSQTLSLEKIYSNSGGRRASWDDWHNSGIIDSDETVYWAWNTGGHANVLIPLYTSGVGSGLFENCIAGSDQVLGDYIDNTDVARVMESALSGVTNKGSLSIIPGQELAGNPVDLTSIANINNSVNVVYTVTEDNSCPAQANNSIITKGDTWKYDIENTGTTWMNTGYDDSGWSAGGGVFGTEPDAASYGYSITTPISNTKKSIFFRKTFTVCNPAEVTALNLNALFDDGMVVYINGTQVYSQGVSGNPPPFDGSAAGHEASGYEAKSLSSVIGLNALRNLLVSGSNVIAVGVYNVLNPGGPGTVSSDIVWDGELVLSNNASGSILFTGNSTEAQSVSTTGWTFGVKNIKVSGSDATCLSPLSDANGTFAFLQLVSYYCDSDGDTYISAAISGSCTGVGCAPSACQTNAGTDCNDSNNAVSPGAPEGPPGSPICMDNLDNDCDGMTDYADGGCHVDHESNCYNAIDDDLDGMTDCDDPDCAGEFNGICTTGQPGICSTGTLICQIGSSVCVADNMPQAEVCDGLDNNCDGNTDNGCDDDGDDYCDNTMTVSGAPLPVCILSADGPGDDCSDSDLNIYPGGPPVRTAGTPPEYFMNIQSAYNSPASVQVLQTQGAVLQEDLLFNTNKTVTLEAGYDCGFSNITDKTTVNGSMTISGGVVTISSGTLELM